MRSRPEVWQGSYVVGVQENVCSSGLRVVSRPISLRYETHWRGDRRTGPDPIVTFLYGRRPLNVRQFSREECFSDRFEHTLRGKCRVAIDVPVVPIQPGHIIIVGMHAVQTGWGVNTQFLGPVQFELESLRWPNTPERDVADYLLRLLFGKPELEAQRLIQLARQPVAPRTNEAAPADSPRKLRGAVVPVKTAWIPQLDLSRIAEIMRDYGYDCAVSRHGTAIVAETTAELKGGPHPLMKSLQASIKRQLREAGLEEE